MANLSKVKVGGLVYNLKDAQSREDLLTLLGSHDLAALGNAAWLGVDEAVSEGGTGVVAGGKIKEYVDAQVATIHKFDVVVADELPTASEATMYKLYLIPAGDSAEKNIKKEYITIRSGVEGAYTYSWELLGDTAIDLSGYVQKTQKIAGIDLQDDITVAEMEGALDLKAMAHAATASGQVEGQTITGVKATGDLSAELTGALGAETAEATIATKADYTPAGSITGEAIKGGSINVTVKDAAAGTAVTDITYSSYTPAGDVTLTKDNENGTFQVSGTISKPAINVNDDAVDTFVKSLKAGDVDAASFTEGEFTPASIADGFFSAGSQASYEHTGFDGGSFVKGTAVAANTDAIKAHIATGSEIAGDVDAETLIFEAAATANVMDHGATFTAATYGKDTFVANTLPSIDTSKFNGGSKAADTFNANKLPVVDGTASAVTAVTAELAANPVFSGDKFVPAFGGTAADIKFAGAKYLKQEIDAHTFTPEAATLGFSGTKAEQLIPTAINYSKTTIGTLGASAALPEGGLSVGDITVSAKNVTVNPDTE